MNPFHATAIILIQHQGFAYGTFALKLEQTTLIITKCYPDPVFLFNESQIGEIEFECQFNCFLIVNKQIISSMNFGENGSRYTEKGARSLDAIHT